MKTVTVHINMLGKAIQLWLSLIENMSLTYVNFTVECYNYVKTQSKPYLQKIMSLANVGMSYVKKNKKTSVKQLTR